jgi:hypothetical protein
VYFVENNPSRYTDPTGHYCLDKAEARGRTVYNACPDDSGGGYRPPRKKPGNNGNFTWQSSNSSSVQVGTGNTYQPYSTMSYAQQAEESSCKGCSVEPTVPNGGGVAGAAGVIGSFLIGNQAGDANRSPDNVFVSLNYSTLPDSSISVTSLSINNLSYSNITVSSVDFVTINNNGPCTSQCFQPYSPSYSIIPPVSMGSADMTLGIGVAAPGTTSLIPLIPSGDALNPNNVFHPSVNVTIFITMIDSQYRTPVGSISYPLR